MKILNLCRRDYAGLAIRLTDAINEYTAHEARLLTNLHHRFEYPLDVVTKDPRKIDKWINWADLVNCWPVYNHRNLSAITSRKLVWVYVGTSFRRYHRKFRVIAQTLRAVELVSTPDLLYYKNLRWLPNAVPVDEWFKMKTRHTGKPIVCQTPSGRSGKKTDIIIEQIKDKENIDLHIIEKTNWSKCLQLKSKADIYLGEFNIGYGMGELESMAMKIPVISHLSPRNERMILKEVGYLAHYDCPIEELSQGVDALLSDKKLYEEYAELGFKYVKQFHDYPVVAKKFTSICEEAMSR